MRTLQSPRSAWRRANTPAALKRRKAKREAAALAGPAPAYPTTAPVYGDWLGGRVNGHTVILRLCREPSHRSDQWAAELDGQVVADAAGLTRLHDLLRSMWPRSQSQRSMTVEQQGYTHQDEIDAMLADHPPA